MSRTPVPVTQLLADAFVEEPAGAEISPEMIVVARGRLGGLFLQITNTAETNATATVRCGSDPHTGSGADLPLTFGPGESHIAGPFESARFVQPGTALHLDFDETFTGTVSGFQKPRSA